MALVVPTAITYFQENMWSMLFGFPFILNNPVIFHHQFDRLLSCSLSLISQIAQSVSNGSINAGRSANMASPPLALLYGGKSNFCWSNMQYSSYCSVRSPAVTSIHGRASALPIDL